MQRRTAWYLAGALVLLVLNGVVLVGVLQKHERVLRVSFLNVGQGDSILIQSPSGTKLLVDGGPDRSVLRELAKQLLPWDRTIDMVVETHPDKDHIAGLGDVLARYQVKTYLDPGVPDSTSVSSHVMEEVDREPGLTHTVARRGMRIHLGAGAYADVLFPDRDESTQKVTNDASIVLHVVYGTTSFMLTGDLPSTLEDHLVALDAVGIKSDVLKAGHHGSKYSTDSIWLDAVDPEVVVISAGKGNTYGHPNPEAVGRIRASGARMVSTIDSGTLTFVSDGVQVTQK